MRVRTLPLLRRGQLAEAAQCIDHFPGLDRRDELLAELLRHAATPAAERADAEMERFRSALRRDARMQRWIEQVAPEALAALDPSHAGATP